MKNISIKAYSFEELSEEVKKKIIDKSREWSEARWMEGIDSDIYNTLDKFGNLFDVRPKVGSHGYIRFDTVKDYPIYYIGKEEEPIYHEEVTGKLLFRYILNNIMLYLTENRIRYLGNKKRYSCLFVEYRDKCQLSGTYIDNYILEPIFDYYENWTKYPKDFSLANLVDKCYNKFYDEIEKEREYAYNNDEYIAEELISEGRLYTEDGIEINNAIIC